MTLRSHDIIAIFNGLFGAEENTLLCGGLEEPFYQPSGSDPARIGFRYDFCRSALHEVAHWCLAGSARREVEDYGYWYTPDDRCELQQAAFFRVEVKPQALEAIFCEAVGLQFRVSLDNLSIAITQDRVDLFAGEVDAAKRRLMAQGLPLRAQLFHQALKRYAASQVPQHPADHCVELQAS
jgi:elongation factor P hydroxylase